MLHPAGIGHGGDRAIYKNFVVKAMVKYILERKLDVLQGLDSTKYERLMKMDESKRESRINGFIAKMYALGFDDEYDDEHDVRYNVERAALRALDIVLNPNEVLSEKGQYQALGMPLGIGYLLVECKDAPKIAKPRYGSTFGTLKKVSYGMGVADLVTESNAYLKSLNNKRIRSLL